MKLRTSLTILAVVFVAACAPRGAIEYGPPAAGADVRPIWVANFRPTGPAGAGRRAPVRPTEMTFQKHSVSVPPTHRPGRVEWPDGGPDARTDFVTLSTQVYPSISRFAAAVARADTGRTGDTVLFVHGYNMTHGEALYQLAQVAQDFEVPSPVVLFSWPSASVASGYVYDRDSVLYARDRLEQVIRALTRQPGRKLVIMGYSLGNQLVMETLRQIAISGDFDIGQRIDALFMVSPDIDVELFHSQAARLRELPDPSVIVAAKKDRALRLSAILTGKTNRLGSQIGRSAVGDLPISVIDVGDLATGGLNHGIALGSPAAIAILKNLNLDALPGEASLQRQPGPGG